MFFYDGHKAIAFTCECRGLQGKAEAIPILHSSFFILMSANGKYYLAMSVRMRLPDGSHRYFVGRLTLAKQRIFWDWVVSEKSAITTTDALAESTVCKYSVAAFQDKCLLKDIKRAFREYYKCERGKSKDALLQFFLETLEMRKAQYNLPAGSVCDWAQEIMGKVIFN